MLFVKSAFMLCAVCLICLVTLPAGAKGLPQDINLS